MDGDFGTACHSPWKCFNPPQYGEPEIREIVSELKRHSGREWEAFTDSCYPGYIRLQSSLEAGVMILHYVTILEEKLKEKSAYIENLNKIIEGFIASVESNKLKNGDTI